MKDALAFFGNLKESAVSTAISLMNGTADTSAGTSNPYISYLKSLVPVAECQSELRHPATPYGNPMGECSLANVPAPILDVAQPDLSKFDLVQLQVIMRHGSRSTCSLLPWETEESFAKDWVRCHTDDQTLDDPKMVSCVPGQLTVSGEEMCIELGKRLRNRYVNQFNLFNDDISVDDMHLESTMYPRARLSLARMLQGLFPQRTFTKPFLDHCVDPQETMVPKPHVCAKLREEYHAAEKACASINLVPEHMAKQAELAQAVGHDYLAEGRTSWVAIGDWASSRVFHGLPLKEGLGTDFLPTAEKAGWARFQTLLSGTASSVHLGIGPFVERILGHMDHAIVGRVPAILDPRNPIAPQAGQCMPPMPASDDPTKGKFADFEASAASPPKLVVFSGHDTTLTPLSAALGIPLLSWPPYSSHIELELWRAANVSSEQAHDLYKHSVRHLIEESPVQPPSPIDSKSLLHVRQAEPERHFRDAHWVRIVFNGVAVSAMPLGVFQERMKHFRSGDVDKRMAACGDMDPNMPAFRWM